MELIQNSKLPQYRCARSASGLLHQVGFGAVYCLLRRCVAYSGEDYWAAKAEGLGQVSMRDDVPSGLVEEVIEEGLSARALSKEEVPIRAT